MRKVWKWCWRCKDFNQVAPNKRRCPTCETVGAMHRREPATRQEQAATLAAFRPAR